MLLKDLLSTREGGVEYLIVYENVLRSSDAIAFGGPNSYGSSIFLR
jgi:hypothetical protein